MNQKEALYHLHKRLIKSRRKRRRISERVGLLIKKIKLIILVHF